MEFAILRAMSPSVAVVGAGSIGGWIADALLHAGWTVSLIARGATLAALRTEGLRVERAGELRRSWPQCGTPAELGVHDYVFLAVKAQVLPDVAPTLGPLIGPCSVIVSATNGIPWWFFHDFGGELANQSLEAVDPGGAQDRAFPRQRILGSVAHASVRVLAPGHVQVVAADRLILGEPGGEITDPLRRAVAGLGLGGINAQLSRRIRHEVWTKLWGNMNMNPVSALTRCGSAAILADADVRELCVRMMEEMQLCARRLGVQVDMTAAERIEVTERLGNFRTSMLADLEAGRPLELAPQLGAVAEIAQRLGVAAPFMRSILGLTRLLSP
ncbi:MAG: 2-dehydropantoate 2-reductase [Steroidobacteraceae bacterium]